MAESIYEIIDRGTMTVEHGTHKIEIEIPWCLRRFKGKMDQDESLLNEFALLDRHQQVGLIHSALASEIIQVRAIPRRIAGEKEINGKMVKMPFAGKETEIEEAVSAYDFTPKRRPGAKAKESAVDQIARDMQAMKTAGMDDAAIVAAIMARVKK